MSEICESFSNGFCQLFDEDALFDDLPANCDEDGLCIDGYDEGCDEYAPDDSICDNCGCLYENCECEE